MKAMYKFVLENIIEEVRTGTESTYFHSIKPENLIIPGTRHSSF